MPEETLDTGFANRSSNRTPYSGSSQGVPRRFFISTGLPLILTRPLMVSIKTRTLLNPGMTMLLSTGCDSGEVDRDLPAMVLPRSSTDGGFRFGRVQGQGVCRMATP